MNVFLNGKLVPEEQAVISVHDRGFLYGDGLFETMRVCNAWPFRWDEHWERLKHGALRLDLAIPYESQAMLTSARQLIQANQLREGILRLTVSRGTGPRGYSPRGATQPCTVMTLFPATERPEAAGWSLHTASLRLATADSLSRFKTCNKLQQIIARAEADAAGAREALLLNTDGTVAEGASSNVFWIKDSVVHTPPVATGILPGVTREAVFELCRKLGTAACEAVATLEELKRAEGVFVTLSTLGVVAVTSLDGFPMPTSVLTTQLAVAYENLVQSETEKYGLLDSR